MKKVYRKPEMGMHVIEIAHMIALSTNNGNSKQEYGQDAKRRRGRGIFDEDSEPEGSIW